jgi:2-amino-4-hydroxy-6-hydroxymethyldihydropteridine diphosphokinase
VSRAVLSIGSNLGDPVAALRGAVEQLAPHLIGVSPVFRTPPWGPVEQSEFLNAVLIVADAQATPLDWLRRSQACEQAAGRVREVRWGPRTLDVDVITVDEVISEDPELTLPHPRAAERAFVLVPWWSLDPEAMLPGRGSVLELMQALPAAEVAAVRLVPGLSLDAPSR